MSTPITAQSLEAMKFTPVDRFHERWTRDVRRCAGQPTRLHVIGSLDGSDGQWTYRRMLIEQSEYTEDSKWTWMYPAGGYVELVIRSNEELASYLTLLSDGAAYNSYTRTYAP